MRGISAARAPSITPLLSPASRSTVRSPAVIVAVLAPGAAVQQIGHAVSDRGSDQQRRRRIFVDIARHVLAGTCALVVHRLHNRAGLLAGAAREILSGLADFGHCRASLLAGAAREILSGLADFGHRRAGRLGSAVYRVANRPGNAGGDRAGLLVLVAGRFLRGGAGTRGGRPPMIVVMPRDFGRGSG